jgi:hypothetical protein
MIFTKTTRKSAIKVKQKVNLRRTGMNFTKKSFVNITSCIIVLLGLLATNHIALGQEQKLVPEKIKGTDLTIDIPAGWQQGAVSGKSILLCKSPDGGLYPNINITALKRENNSLKDAYDHSLILLNKPQIFKEEMLTVNEIPAHYSAVIWMSPLGGLKSVRLFIKQKDNSIIMISYVDRDTGFTADDYRLYLKSIHSVRHSINDF